jgi:hypothetical protein
VTVCLPLTTIHVGAHERWLAPLCRPTNHRTTPPSLHELERRLQAVEAETQAQEKGPSNEDDADDVGEGLAALRFNLRGQIDAIPIKSAGGAVIKLRVLLDQEASRDREDLAYKESDRGTIKQVLAWLEGQQHAAAPVKPKPRSNAKGIGVVPDELAEAMRDLMAVSHLLEEGEYSDLFNNPPHA